MIRSVLFGTALGLGVGLTGVAQGQFFTDFNDDESFSNVLTIGTGNINTPVTQNVLPGSEHFVGGGGFFESGLGGPFAFESRTPASSYDVSGGVASLAVDSSGLADIRPDDPNTPDNEAGFAFWFSGITIPGVQLTGAASASDVEFTANVLGTGANGPDPAQADIRMVIAQEALTDLEYTLNTDPNSFNVFTVIGGNVANLFDDNDDDIFNPKTPIDWTQPIEIKLLYGSEANGWGTDADNLIQIDSVNIVPEPASAALLGLGGLALLARRR